MVGLAKNDAVKYSNELFFFFVKWMYVKTPLVTTNKYHNILRHNAEWGLKRRHFFSQQNWPDKFDWDHSENWKCMHTFGWPHLYYAVKIDWPIWNADRAFCRSAMQDERGSRLGNCSALKIRPPRPTINNAIRPEYWF